ncbi:hypothetical protein [Falsibacillus albus]|uniref:Uncharacterized protein n=1 Tax=Falsibacillus albus TaxID=2478915 RepID=A0A3L7K3I9_9BACI|nr:hypothetical protein [Falsibacillus albus]RLQ96839.1 hypothetical protein D9X91_07000 [Falsibacillus albus]
MKPYCFKIDRIYKSGEWHPDRNWFLVFKEKHIPKELQELSIRDISDVLHDRKYAFINNSTSHNSVIRMNRLPLKQETRFEICFRRTTFLSKLLVVFNLVEGYIYVSSNNSSHRLTENIVLSVLSCFLLENEKWISFLYIPKKPKLPVLATKRKRKD